MIFSGWKWVNKNDYEFVLYIYMIILTILASSVFPWKWFNKIPLTVIQLSFRYLTYVILFGSILGSKEIVKLLGEKICGSRSLVWLLLRF